MWAVALAVWWSVLIGGVLSPTHAQVTLRAPEAGAVEVAPVQQAPPIPVEGIPPGWTEEQWTHFGAQWLEQEGARVPEIAPQVSAPPEDDLDLDL